LKRITVAYFLQYVENRKCQHEIRLSSVHCEW